MTASSAALDARLARWAAGHAVLLLAATAAALAWNTLWPVALAGTASFGGFVGAFRRHWTPTGLSGLKIESELGNPCKIIYNDKTLEEDIEKGETRNLHKVL
ncbi:MAG: hypothetical protein R6U20_12920 [Longimonas sp.]|uniref:hypothetical protein n=1 Tax=Longimonas sp. TaxID=2039626 RepID=UPI00397667C4